MIQRKKLRNWEIPEPVADLTPYQLSLPHSCGAAGDDVLNECDGMTGGSEQFDNLAIESGNAIRLTSRLSLKDAFHGFNGSHNLPVR